MKTADSKFVLKVLHVSPECTPLAKKGGLGDVAGALPKALRKNGVDARVLMPAWPGVLDNAHELGILPSRPFATISTAINWRSLSAKVWRVNLDGVPVYILENDEIFSNGDIYPEDMNAESAVPMIFLSYASLELAHAANWKAQIIHAHDWPSAIIPSALRWHRYYSSMAGEYDTVYTIHNIAHQGLFHRECLNGWGIAPEALSAFGPGSLEFYGMVNLMKGAINTAEAITTVSPSFSWNIQTPEGGFGLDGVTSANRYKLRGILNGIDYDVWNPKTDALIPEHYSAKDLSGKKICRSKLMKELGWEDDGRPLLVSVGRLTEQKGVDIMLDALERFLPDHVYALIIGSGNDYYNRRLEDFRERHDDSVRTVMAFDEQKAHSAYAAGDILLMPSLFEPCGLSQLIAFAYGTIPVARVTGGLADTVIDADGSQDGNGFLFRDYSIDELEQAIHRALWAKGNEERWHGIMLNAMNSDFSWDNSAKEYVKLYNDIIAAE